MPRTNITRYPLAQENPTVRFKIKATGETGSAVAPNDRPAQIHQAVCIGPKHNVLVIDLCLDDSGEIKRFLAEKLEEITEDNE